MIETFETHPPGCAYPGLSVHRQLRSTRLARWLDEWKKRKTEKIIMRTENNANRVVDMKAKGVQFEAVRRAVMGGYLKWEEDSTGGGGGESEVATAEAQGREEAQQGTPESQQIVAVGVKQGRDGDLARVYIECSGKGFPAARTEGVQPCGSQHHETLRAAELCAKAVSEGQECRWGGMLEKGGRRNARGVTQAEPQKDRGRRTRERTHRLGTGVQPHRLAGGEQADGMAVGDGRQGGSLQGTVGRRGRQQAKPPEHPTRRDKGQVKTRQGNTASGTSDQGGGGQSRRRGGSTVPEEEVRIGTNRSLCTQCGRLDAGLTCQAAHNPPQRGCRPNHLNLSQTENNATEERWVAVRTSLCQVIYPQGRP